jgi:hypothetical protein
LIIIIIIIIIILTKDLKYKDLTIQILKYKDLTVQILKYKDLTIQILKYKDLTVQILKYKDVTIQIQHMWNVTTKVVPVVITVATGTISKSLRQYLSNIPGKHEIKELPKKKRPCCALHTNCGKC